MIDNFFHTLQQWPNLTLFTVVIGIALFAFLTEPKTYKNF